MRAITCRYSCALLPIRNGATNSNWRTAKLVKFSPSVVRFFFLPVLLSGEKLKSPTNRKFTVNFLVGYRWSRPSRLMYPFGIFNPLWAFRFTCHDNIRELEWQSSELSLRGSHTTQYTSYMYFYLELVASWRTLHLFIIFYETYVTESAYLFPPLPGSLSSAFNLHSRALFASLEPLSRLTWDEKCYYIDFSRVNGKYAHLNFPNPPVWEPSANLSQTDPLLDPLRVSNRQSFGKHEIEGQKEVRRWRKNRRKIVWRQPKLIWITRSIMDQFEHVDSPLSLSWLPLSPFFPSYKTV